MELSDRGLAFLTEREGLLLRAYRDSVGIWTIGVGHVIHPSDSADPEHLTISEAQARMWLRLDVQIAERAVTALVTAVLLQHQFDALVSFVFNVGVAAFQGSTLLKRLNRGDLRGASEQFKRWAFAGGRVIAGLVDRRARERMLFDSAFYGKD